jgi:FkbM family methyltransferase
MASLEAGTFLATLRVLLNKGIRYSTVIDVGCADGNFFLNHSATGLFPGAVPLNIDANDLYEDSLRAIKAAVGGDFRISAITDHEGDVELTTSAHPYWSSLRPRNDPYWMRVNNLISTKRLVPATTLDTLRKQLALAPPYLIKLDVQGGEHAVLRGAADVLKDTHVVICQADVEDFQDINDVLAQNYFVLYDVTHVGRAPDGTLGWFYPVYLNRALQHVRPKEFWQAEHNEVTINLQVRHRESILKDNAALIARIRERKDLTQDMDARHKAGHDGKCSKAAI